MTIEIDGKLADSANIASAAVGLSSRELVLSCLQAGIWTLAEQSPALAAALAYLDNR